MYVLCMHGNMHYVKVRQYLHPAEDKTISELKKIRKPPNQTRKKETNEKQPNHTVVLYRAVVCNPCTVLYVICVIFDTL